MGNWAHRRSARNWALLYRYSDRLSFTQATSWDSMCPQALCGVGLCCLVVVPAGCALRCSNVTSVAFQCRVTRICLIEGSPDSALRDCLYNKAGSVPASSSVTGRHQADAFSSTFIWCFHATAYYGCADWLVTGDVLNILLCPQVVAVLARAFPTDFHCQSKYCEPIQQLRRLCFAYRTMSRFHAGV